MTPFKVFLRRWHYLFLLGIAGILCSPVPAIAIDLDHPDRNDEDISQLIAWDYSGSVYCNRLYDISGRLLVQLRGGTPDFTPDGRHFLSASLADNRTYLYDLHGNSIAELEGGEFEGFTANGQLVIREANPYGGQTYLYDLSGRRLVTFGERQIELSLETDVNYTETDFNIGNSGRLSPNRLQVATYSFTRDTSYLYDLAGNQIAQFEGEFLGFSPNGQQLVTYAYTIDRSYLHNIWGRRLADSSGRFLRFSADGQYLMTSTTNEQGDTQNHVYDLFGNELDSSQFSEEDWADNSPPAPLTDHLPEFQGEFRSLSPNRQLFLTNSEMIAEQRVVEERIRVGELAAEDFARSVCPRVTR